MRVRYHRAAEAELLDEIAWLESQSAGLGQRLLDEVLRAEDQLRRFPESAEEVRPSIRRLVLRAFPYSIFYTIDQEGLIILAFGHQHRRPDYWLPRLSTDD